MTASNDSSYASGHLSRFMMERLLAQDVMGVAEQERAFAHTQVCDDCRKVFVALQEERSAFLNTFPYAQFRIRHEQKRASRKRLRLRFTIPALATASAFGAAMLVMVATTPSPRPSPSANAIATDSAATERMKGDGVALSFVVASPSGAVVPGISGEAYSAGSKIQLRYDIGQQSHMAVVGIDSQGHVSTYFPENGETLVPAPMGPQGSLPFSLTLDGTSQGERFYLIGGDSATSIDSVRAALSKASSWQTDTLTVPADLKHSSVWLQVR